MSRKKAEEIINHVIKDATMATTKRATAATVLAQNWGWDRSDVDEHRYQGGHTPVPVFAFDDGYYCVSKRTPPAFLGLKWTKWTGNQSVATLYGTTVWHMRPA